MIDKAVRTLFVTTESAVLTAADGVRRAWHQAGQTLTGNAVRIEGRGIRLEGEEKFKRRCLGNAAELELPAADDVAQPVGLPEKSFDRRAALYSPLSFLLIPETAASVKGEMRFFAKIQP